ncbi:MAG: iron ABC transporter permease, partial [Pseudothermotoga sp.]|nr:iron ABC transporter permease [Pseudothermotoga sp.]
FGNPLVLGGRFHVLSVSAYLEITGSYRIPHGSALAIILLIPTLIAFFVQRYWLSRKSFVTVTGKSFLSRAMELPKWAKGILTVVCLILTASIWLFYGTVLFGSFTKLWGVNHSLTLDNYKYVFNFSWEYMKDTLFLASIATPICGVLGIMIAYLVSRKDFFGRRIIILVFVFRELPVGVQNGVAALYQIDKSIEEASMDLGSNSYQTFWKVTLPLLMPAFFTALFNAFVRSMTAISAVIFVVSAKWNLITVRILGAVSNGDLAQAAALSCTLIGIIVVAMFLMRFATINLSYQMKLRRVER